jgi:hypothetical protein
MAQENPSILRFKQTILEDFHVLYNFSVDYDTIKFSTIKNE